MQTSTNPYRIIIKEVTLITDYLSNLIFTRVIKRKDIYFDIKRELLYMNSRDVLYYASETYGHYVLIETAPPSIYTTLANSYEEI